MYGVVRGKRTGDGADWGEGPDAAIGGTNHEREMVMATMKIETKDRAYETLNAAHERDPQTYRFGCLTGDDWAMSGVSIFGWFDAPASLLSTFAECEPYVYIDEEDEEFATVRTALEATIGPLAERTSLPEDLRVELNRIMEGHCQIHWWGTFEDLCRSDGEWEREFRSSFRDSTQEEVGSTTDAVRARPITEAEIDDFVAFIREYGY